LIRTDPKCLEVSESNILIIYLVCIHGKKEWKNAEDSETPLTASLSIFTTVVYYEEDFLSGFVKRVVVGPDPLAFIMFIK